VPVSVRVPAAVAAKADVPTPPATAVGEDDSFSGDGTVDGIRGEDRRGRGGNLVTLDEGECTAAAAGAYGRKFDAQGTPTACGVAVLAMNVPLAVRALPS
jgi:hypothetical protein